MDILDAREHRTSRCEWRNRTGKVSYYKLGLRDSASKPVSADSGILCKPGDHSQWWIHCQGHRDGRLVLGSEDIPPASRYEVMSNRDTLPGLTPSSNQFSIWKSEHIKKCIILRFLSSQSHLDLGKMESAAWQPGNLAFRPSRDFCSEVNGQVTFSYEATELGDIALWQVATERQHPPFSSPYDVCSYPQSTNGASGIKKQYR